MNRDTLEDYFGALSEETAAERQRRIEMQRSRCSAERHERARSIARALERPAE